MRVSYLIDMERIDKILAQSGYGSRKEIKQMIKAGRIQVADQVIDDSGYKIDLIDLPLLTIDGQNVKIYDSLTFMLNKPSGYITALNDDHHRTIAEFIPEKWQNKGLFPIGRLDKDTEGLLLISNDGQLSHRICSPKWEIKKTYWLIIEGKPFQQDDIEKFSQGFNTLDGSIFLPSELKIIDGYEAELTVYEGQYHQVKRMMKSTGREVKLLRRIQIAHLELDPKLESGEMRLLTDNEKADLYHTCQLD